MNSTTRTQIEELYIQYQAEDAAKTDRLERWRNLEPGSALLITIMIKGKQARKMLEIGTSNGYSTLWFADALKSTDGTLTTIEIEADRTALAKESLQRFDLLSNVELVTGDAKDFLITARPDYDILFLDAERTHYVTYLADLKRLISQHRGAMLFVDNVISHRAEVEEFIGLLEKDNDWIYTVIDVGAGLLIATMNED